MAKSEAASPTAEQLLVDDLAEKEQRLSAREAAIAEEAKRIDQLQSKVEAMAAKVEAQASGGSQPVAEQRISSTASVKRRATGVYRVFVQSTDYGNWQVVVDCCCDESEAVRCALASRNITDTHLVRCTVEKLSA